MGEYIIPAIRQRINWLQGGRIVIQQDGARPHTGKGNLLYLEALGHQDGWDITSLLKVRI